MMDMTNIGRDFTPRRRRPEEGFAPQAPPMGASAPGVSTGQPQPFTPVAGQPPGQSPDGRMLDFMGRPIGPSQEQIAAQQGQVAPGGQPQLPPSDEVSVTGQITGTPGVSGQPLVDIQQRPDSRVTLDGFSGGGAVQARSTGAEADLRARGYDVDPLTGQPTGGAGAGAPGGGFPYPEQWQQAGDIYGQLAGGMPGMPDPGAMWGGYQQQAGDLSRELAEQAGMGMGTRYGSALQRNIADVGMRAGERFGGEMERLRMGDVAGQRQAMLGAAGGLSGLGGAYAMLPGQLSGQAMGLGQQYQGMQNIPLQAQYQEWMRQQPEYSPYLQYMQQGAQVPYGPQTYQPGWGSSLMDIGGQLGMYSMMGGW